MEGIVPIDPERRRTLHHRQYVSEGALADLQPIVPPVDDIILSLVIVRLRCQERDLYYVENSNLSAVVVSSFYF
jgi:hypothetical protein